MPKTLNVWRTSVFLKGKSVTETCENCRWCKLRYTPLFSKIQRGMCTRFPKWIKELKTDEHVCGEWKKKE